MILSLEGAYCPFEVELILEGKDFYAIEVSGTWKIPLQTPQSYYLKTADQQIIQSHSREMISFTFKSFRDEDYPHQWSKTVSWETQQKQSEDD